MACPFLSSTTRPSATEELARIQDHYPLLASTSCTDNFCQSGRMIHTTEPRVGVDSSIEQTELEAVDFLTQLRRDDIITSDEALHARIHQAKTEIRASSKVIPGPKGTAPMLVGGTWTQTFEELEHGVRLAWKHSKRCIMRSEHLSLKVVDFRHIRTSKEMGEVLVQAMKDAFCHGNIVTSAFIFPPRQPDESGPMIWNNNSLHYAGYKQPDGTILGEPANVSFTKEVIKLGWKPPALRSRWDLLPIVTMAQDDSPYITEISKVDFPDVHIGHPNPQHDLAFRKLGLRWVVSPVLSRLGFDIGGVQYTATPFMGFFADMEIGVRNLADRARYNALPSVVNALNLLPKNQTLEELPPYEQLAKLQAAQSELNRAVYWSYAQAGVRMIDTLTASTMYCDYDDIHLAEKGFRLPADPYWLSPPQGSIVPLWHRGGAPNYQPRPMICKHREDPVKTWERRKIAWEASSSVKLIPAATDTLKSVEDGDRELTTSASALSLTRPKLTARDSAISISSGPSLRIHYCGSGSTARRLAQKLEHRLQVFLGKYEIPVYQISEATPLNSLNLESSSDDDLIFIIASSSGRGDVPMNGITFLRKYQNHRSFSATVSGLPHARFAVFGNGNSTYGPTDFNGAALKIERVLSNTGLKSLVPLFHGDVSKQDPPIEQFIKFWQSILDIMTTDDILGPDSGSNGSTFLSHHEAQPEEITNFELPNVQPATFKSATGTGGMKRVSLDIGQAEYGDLSHVRVYIPLQPEDLSELLSTLHLTGDEVPEVPGKATTRQILALTDVSKPFTHTRWIDREDLYTNNGNYEILTNLPFSSAIVFPPVIKWLEKEGLSNPDVLSTFISAIPLVEYRTFSTASSLRAQEGSNGNNMLDLIVKIREGGGFTEEFLNRAKDGDLLYVDIRDGPSKFLVEANIPIVVFAQGAGIAPLRSLLQARVALSDQRRTDLEKITLFLAYRPDDQVLIDEVIRDAECAEVLDSVYKQASNPDQIRVQERMLRDPKAREDVRKKVVNDGANVFVIASRAASNEFEVYLGAVIGRDDIKSALDGRWDEEVFVG